MTMPLDQVHSLLQRFELAIASAGFGLWELDLSNHVMIWDSQMYAIYGVTPETFTPNRENWRARVHPEDRHKGTANFDKALNGAFIDNFESRIVHPDGSIHYIEAAGRMQTDVAGQPTMIVGLNRDITVRKMAELHGVLVARTMTSIVEKNPLSMILEEIVNFIEARHISSSCSILLLSPLGDEFHFGAGAKLKDFYETSLRGLKIGPSVGACGAAVFTKRQVVDADIMNDSKWTAFRDATRDLGVRSCWSQPIFSGERVLGTFAIYHSQTHQPSENDVQIVEACAQLAAVAIQHSQTEEALETQRTKMLSSIKMAALGEMASGIAHEVNNPLTIIVGKAWQLKAQVDSGTVDRTAFSNELGQIVDVSNRIAKVIRGLQSFSRNAEQDPFEHILISQVVDDALELSKERFRNNGIEIKLLIKDKMLAVAARPAQITQVLLNLLNNAFDAVSCLDEKWVELSVVVRKEVVFISMTDSGSGLDSVVAEKVMQPFFTTKDVGRGTGLGLSISKGIIEDHHGRLYYDPSSPRTRFVIELPLERASQ